MLEPLLRSKMFTDIGMKLVELQRAGRNITPSFDKMFLPFAQCHEDKTKAVVITDFFDAANDTKYLGSQGVLLLPASFTNEAGGESHMELWRLFVTQVIKCISFYKECLVFLVVGKEAQRFSGCVNSSKHTILNNTEKIPSYNIFQHAGAIIDFLHNEPIAWRPNQVRAAMFRR